MKITFGLELCRRQEREEKTCGRLNVPTAVNFKKSRRFNLSLIIFLRWDLIIKSIGAYQVFFNSVEIKPVNRPFYVRTDHLNFIGRNELEKRIFPEPRF